MDIILSAIDNMSQQVKKATMKTRAHLTKLEKSEGFAAFDRMGNNAIVTGGLITAAMGASILSAEGAATAQARLAQVFKSMGETSGVAARRAMEYADALELQTGVDGDLIMLSQAKLATFKEVSSESARMAGIFDRATAATVDLAAAGFGSAEGNAVQLGKALNDPIKGITSLTKSGVTFTQAEQTKIKALTESGRILQAQEMILKAVETQVGGVAAATANDSAKMVVAYGQVTEAVGMVLLPVLQELTAWTQDFVPKFQKFIDQNPQVVKAVAAAGVALLTFGIAAKLVTTIVGIMNAVMLINPYILIGLAIVAAIAAVVLMVKHWDELVARFKDAPVWAKVLIGVFAAMNLPLLGLIFVIRKVRDNWDAISAFFISRWDAIVSKFLWVVDFLKAIHTKLFDAGANIVMSIWNGMKSRFDGMIDWFGTKIQTIRDYLPFSPAKIGPLKDIHRLKIIETIQQSIKPAKLAGTMEQAAGAARSAFMGGIAQPVGAPALSPAGGSGGAISVNYSPTINLSGGDGTVADQITQVLNLQVDELRRMLRQIAADEARRAM